MNVKILVAQISKIQPNSSFGKQKKKIRGMIDYDHSERINWISCKQVKDQVNKRRKKMDVVVAVLFHRITFMNFVKIVF